MVLNQKVLVKKSLNGIPAKRQQNVYRDFRTEMKAKCTQEATDERRGREIGQIIENIFPRILQFGPCPIF